MIWEWGIVNIVDNPIFGIGFNEWVRHYWMSTSFDMFWLLPAMRHGIVVGALFIVLFFWVFFQTVYAKVSDPKIQAYRTGYLATLFGLFMAGWTVHYWDATLVLFMFLLSSGMWISDEGTAAPNDPKTSPDDEVPLGIRYSRFRTNHNRAPS